MSWDKIYGQKTAKKILRRAAASEKIAGAYLFYGPEGTGKDAAALEFAKTANCKNPFEEDGGISPCGVCSSCKLASSLRNPNIDLVFALPAGKSGASKSDSPLSALSDEQIEELREELALKADDPYYKIKLTGANKIKIDQVREIKKKLSMTPGSGGRRFVIVFDADEMTQEAANSFLKTLEEPHESVTIILVTSRKDAILQTILSRTQQIMFEPLSDDDVISALGKRAGIEEAAAGLIAAFARGSLSVALEYIDTDMQQIRSDTIEMLRTSLTRKGFRLKLSELIDEASKSKDKSRIEITATILLLWLRDALTIAKTGKVSGLVNADRADEISKFAANFGKKNLFDSIDAIERAVLRSKRNVAPQLNLLSMFLKLREILLGKGK